MSPNYQYFFWEIMEWGLTNPYYSIFEQIQRNQAGVVYKGYQLPEPWNGDIENAEVIFVGLNPSFNPEEFNPHDVSIDPDSYWAAQKGSNAKIINGIGYDQKRIEDFFENRFSGNASGFGSIATRSYINGKYKYNYLFSNSYKYVDGFRTLQQDTSYSKAVKYWQNADKLVKTILRRNVSIGKDFAFLEIIPCKSQSSDGLSIKINNNGIQAQFINNIFVNLLNLLCNGKSRTFIVLGKKDGGAVFHDIISRLDKGFRISFDDIWGDGYRELGKSLPITISNNKHNVIFWPHPSGPVEGFTDDKWIDLRKRD